MTRRRTSLWEFVENHFVEKENYARQALLRDRLARSELLIMMDRVAQTVNTKAGTLLIEAQPYLAPEPLVRSFGFRKDDTEYLLQLESWVSGPTVVFLTRNWRGPLFWRRARLDLAAAGSGGTCDRRQA
jgi:hypothetical protein